MNSSSLLIKIGRNKSSSFVYPYALIFAQEIRGFITYEFQVVSYELRVLILRK